MTDIVCEIMLTIDGAARGEKSPAYCGYTGPEFMAWLAEKNAQTHRTLIGRKTLDALSSIPATYQDEGYRRMTANPGWLFRLCSVVRPGRA